MVSNITGMNLGDNYATEGVRLLATSIALLRQKTVTPLARPLAHI